MMRRHWFGLVLGLLLGISIAGRADEQDEGRKLADAAIQAAGGPVKLDQLKAVTLKGKGVVSEDGTDAAFTFDGTVQGQDHFRLNLELEHNGQMEKLVVVLNGDKGWVKHGDDKVEEFPAEVLPLIQAELHALRLSQMLTNLKNQAVTVTPLGEMKVNDRPAQGLKIVRKDRPDVDLFLDKETSLPIKCQLRVREPKQEQEVTHAWFFSSFKDVGGAKHPMKVALHRDEKKLFELELSEVKIEEKVDENTFSMP
jgi:hypothetical protein